MKKKILALALAFVMLFAVLPTSGLAIADTPLNEQDAVASVVSGETTTYYATLPEAVAAAQSGDTVNLLKDAEGSGVKIITANAKNLVLDFGGHTYTMNGTAVGSAGTESQAFHFEKGCNITMRNGKITATTAQMLVQNYCNLTLSNIELVSSQDYTLSNNCGHVVIGSGTTIKTTKENGIAFDVCVTNYYPDGTQVTVQPGATIKGNIEYGVWGSVPQENKATLTISGGTIEGSFVVNNSLTDAAESKITITGGTFTDTVNAAKYLADGVKLSENGNVVSKYVAQIGETKYESLADAIAAVPVNGSEPTTITMIADVEDAHGISVAENKNFIVDFANHTYTVNKPGAGSTGTETSAFQLLKGSTITFKNGTLNIAEENLTPAVAPAKNIMRLIQNYANLTLDNMTINAKNQYGGEAYVVSFNNGTSVIKDTKIITSNANTVAFDVYLNAYYTSTSVTVQGNSEIKGSIEIAATSPENGQKVALQLEGGSVTGVIQMGNNADQATVTKAATVSVAASTGYKWDEGKLVKVNYVAEVNGVQYETLKDAIAAVPTDGTETTITMIANETIDIATSPLTVAAGKNVVLDLNGQTITGYCESATTSALITNKGTLTIKDTATAGGGQLRSGATATWVYDGSGNYAGSYASNTITNSGNLTVEGGYIENISKGSAVYAIDNNSSSANAIVTITGGTVKANSVAIRQFANSVTLDNTVNISGGTVTAGYSGIWVQLPNSDATKAVKAALNVSGGTLDGGSYAFYDYSYGNSFDNTHFELSGGTFDGDIFSYGANINISDGEFKGDVAIKQTKPSTVQVSGGKFDSDVYTFGDHPSTGFITGGVFMSTTYEDEGKTYDCDWISLIAEDYEYVEITASYPYKVQKKISVDLDATIQATGSETAVDYIADAATTVNAAVAEAAQQGKTIDPSAASFQATLSLSKNEEQDPSIPGTEIPTGATVYEVHPVMTVTDGTSTYSYKVPNSELAANAEFDVTITLPKTNTKYTIKHIGTDGNQIGVDIVATTNSENEVTVTLSSFSYLLATENVSPVAQIGDVKYETLAEAFAAAQNGNTITMLADSVEADEPVLNLNGSVTLDLNGKIVTANHDIWVKTGSLTVIGSAGSKIQSTGYAFYVSTQSIQNNVATLTINSYDVTIDADNFGIAVMSGGVVNLQAGSIISGGTGIANNGSNQDATTINITGGSINATGHGIYHPGPGTLTIGVENHPNNHACPTITGKTGIEMRAGTLNVYCGTITAIGDFAEEANGSGTTVDGAAVAVSQHTTDLPITVNIAGGTLTATGTGSYGIYEKDQQNPATGAAVGINVSGGVISGVATGITVTDVALDSVSVAVSGGEFSSAVPEAYCKEGFEPKENGDDTYGVEEKTVDPVISDTVYGYVDANNMFLYDSLMFHTYIKLTEAGEALEGVKLVVQYVSDPRQNTTYTLSELTKDGYGTYDITLAVRPRHLYKGITFQLQKADGTVIGIGANSTDTARESVDVCPNDYLGRLTQKLNVVAALRAYANAAVEAWGDGPVY